jgi:hypothetical protein
MCGILSNSPQRQLCPTLWKGLGRYDWVKNPEEGSLFWITHVGSESQKSYKRESEGGDKA